MKKARSSYNFKVILISLLVTEVLFWVIFGALYYFILKFVPNVRFDNPEAFWFLTAIPAMTVIYLLVLRRKNTRIRRFAEEELVPFVMPSLSTTRSLLKFLFFKFGIACIILALVDPKIGTKLKEIKSTGIDIMFCLDVSNSMLAQDIEPNRLERAKRSITQVIDQLHGDRIGVVIFAGNAYIQLPITTDYDAAKLFIAGVDTDMLSVQGTSIGAAVELAASSFDPESPAHKSIVIITDGENHEDDAITAVKEAAKSGIAVHAIGMGSIEGAPIPVLNNRGRQVGFKEDESGHTVVTALNESMLTDIVDAGDGIFIRATGNFVAVNDLVAALSQEEKAELETMQFADYEHRFQWFLVLAAIFLLLDSIIATDRKNWSKELNIFD